MLTALVAVVLLAPAWSPGLRPANAYADGRPGTVTFAVRTDRRLWGRDLDRPVQSASVVKALLLVAYLRQPSVRSRALRPDERRLLSPMVRWSNNRRAGEVATRLGAARVDRAAHRGGMRRFHLVMPCWGCSLITAREQSRFFLHLDTLVPPRHRAFAMELLRTVVHTQRWGIAEVAPAGWTLYFKGGWGSGTGLVDHQVALLQRGRERVSVAILTTVNGTHRNGKATLRGVARRLLRGRPRSPAVRPRLERRHQRGLARSGRLLGEEALGARGGRRARAGRARRARPRSRRARRAGGCGRAPRRGRARSRWASSASIRSSMPLTGWTLETRRRPRSCASPSDAQRRAQVAQGADARRRRGRPS